VEAANDGLWDWNLHTNRMSFSGRWRRILGLEDDVFSGGPDDWFRRTLLDDAARVQVELERLLFGGVPFVQFECRMHHRDGTVRALLVRAIAARDSQGNVHRVAGSHTDLSAQKAVESRLLHGALHDSLTNLPNRALFHHRLRLAFERTDGASGCRFAVLFVDLDRFKSINDTLGHQAGDELLAAVAARLRGCVRGSDTLARLGGDEFAILAEGVEDLEDAILLAERAKEAFGEPFRLATVVVTATASIGIALCASSYETPGDVLRDADTAMYRAKALGRNRYEIFREARAALGAHDLHFHSLVGEARRLAASVVLFWERSVQGRTSVPAALQSSG